MKKILLFSILFVATFSLGFAQTTWNGSVSSDWNTAANWTPANVPNANNEDALINGAGTFQPVMTSNISIRDIRVTGGSLGLAGFTLTSSRNGIFTGGSINNGNLVINDFNNLSNMVFNGTMTLTKSAGNDDDLQGGNIFNGPTTITNSDGNRLRFAQTNGDTFNALLTINKNNTGNIEMAYSGTNSINSIIINNTNTGGQMNFGVGGGTSTMVTDGLITTGFVGTLVINNMTQTLNVANSTFNITTFTVANSTFLGNFQVTTSGNMTFTGANTFQGNNTFISGGQITMTAGGNTFSLPSNATIITRNGGGGITWGPGNTFGNLTLTNNGGQLVMNGGNIFNGNTLMINESNNNIRLAEIVGDTFNGPVIFQNNGTAFFDISRRGANIFEDQVTINNTDATGEIRIGELGGTSELRNGGLVTTDFMACNIFEINNFTQLTNAPNGPVFNTLTFTSANSSFLGDFVVNTTGIGTMTFTGSNRYDGTNIFNSNARIVMSGSNFFSTVPGNNSTFVKGPASNTDDAWFGGNTFGPVQITNNSPGGYIRMANTNGDTFLGTSVFILNTIDVFDIAFNGNSSFADQITIDNNGGGTMRFGGTTAQNGTSIQTNGALTTTNFNSGILNVRRFTQTTPVPNSVFNPVTFESQNSSFQGDFTVNATTITFLGANTFARNNSFISSGQMNMATGGNLFSNPGNTTILTRNGGAAGVTWGPGNTFGTLLLTDNSAQSLTMQGGNTFGPATIINNGNKLVRLANTQGDTFAGTSTFINNGTNTFEIARAGTNLFGDNVTINNLNAGGTMNFGINGGTSTLTNGGLLTTNYSVGNTLTINNFSQLASVPNGDFSMNTFSASASTFNGDIGITTLTGAITLQNSSVFAGDDTFNSAGLISILNNSSFPGNDIFTAATSIAISNNNTFSGTNAFTAGTTMLIANNNTVAGNNTFSTGTGGITIDNDNAFPDNNTFTAATGIQLNNGGNSFSTNAGTLTTMIKNGATTNDWQGGNTFGDFTLVNNGTGRIRTANSAGGDTFLGDVTFDKNSTGAMEPAFNDISTFAGDISTALSNTVLTFGLGTGTVEINGSTAQNLLTDGTLIPVLRRVRMNGTGTLELSDPISIPISLELIGGIINNNEDLLTFPSGSFVTGGSNASHVNGRIRKVGITAFTYPFGNDGFYAPLTTSAITGAATQHFTGRYFHVNPDPLYDRDSKEPSIGIVNGCEYWELVNTNSTAIPTLTMSWSSDRTCPIDDYNEFMVTKWDGTQWTDLGQDALSGNATSGTVRNLTPTPNFSPGIFTLSQSFRILPIELLSFTAAITEDEKIKVSWSTAMEKNNAFFTLEKSLDGSTWSPIGIIPGAGDSDIILFYDFIDESPVFGRQYYRLTQTDYDGTSETFKVVGVTLQSNKETIEYKVYPNPSSGIVKILSQNTNMEEAEIMVLDNQGQIVRTVKGISGRLVEMDLSSLPKGLYLIKIKNNYHWETKKVVIN